MKLIHERFVERRNIFKIFISQNFKKALSSLFILLIALTAIIHIAVFILFDFVTSVGLFLIVFIILMHTCVQQLKKVKLYILKLKKL